MGILRMTCSAISLCALAASCRPAAMHHAERVPLETSSIAVPYFSDSATDYLYKATLKFAGRDESGLLVIKRTGRDTYRAVLTTQFGNRLLDVQWTPTGYTVNFALPNLQKTFILNRLVADLRMMTGGTQPVSKEFAGTDGKWYVSGTRGQRMYFGLDNGGSLILVSRYGWMVEQASVRYGEVGIQGAVHLMLQHRRPRFTLELRRLGE